MSFLLYFIFVFILQKITRWGLPAVFELRSKFSSSKQETEKLLKISQSSWGINLLPVSIVNVFLYVFDIKFLWVLLQLRNDFASAMEVFKNRTQKQNNQTKCSIKKEIQNTIQSSGNGFAAKLLFFKNQENQNNQLTPIREASRNSQKSSNILNKVSMFNSLKVPLGQPTDYTKKCNSNYQTDENSQPQLAHN